MTIYCSICYDILYEQVVGKKNKHSNGLPNRTQVYECECQNVICNQCVVNWVEQNCSSQLQKGEISIKCPSNDCRKIFTLHEILNLFGNKSTKGDRSYLNHFNTLNEIAYLHYLHHDKDIKKCPKYGCTYSGFVDKTKCNGDFICSKCGYEWRDQTQEDSKIFSFVSLIETQTYLHKLFFEEPCPRCGIWIYKQGGCNHMHCITCQYEFCWWCLGSSRDDLHNKRKVCPYRYYAIIWPIVLLIMLFNQKVIYNFETLFEIEWFIFFNLSAFFTLIGFFLSFLPHYVNGHDGYQFYKYSRQSSSKLQVIQTYALRALKSFALLGVQIAFVYYLYDTELIQRSVLFAKSILVMILAGFTLFGLIWLCYLIYRGIKTLIHKVINYAFASFGCNFRFCKCLCKKSKDDTILKPFKQGKKGGSKTAENADDFYLPKAHAKINQKKVSSKNNQKGVNVNNQNKHRN